MKWQQYVIDEFLRIEQELGFVLEGLSVDDLNRQPAPDCNSIGWCAWHLTRSHDRNMPEMMGEANVVIASRLKDHGSDKCYRAGFPLFLEHERCTILRTFLRGGLPL